MAITTESTTFTRDIYGRYICNTFAEALASTDQAKGGTPFDVIIIGGGSFGGVLAHRLFSLDQRLRRHRILVLEAGPLLLTEHIQNIPPLLSDVFQEVRWVPWQSPGQNFPGLASCLAGRSLFWGGWSPELMDSELTAWPPELVNDLKQVYFSEAARQIGTDQTNDFIFGSLHSALRNNLWNNRGQIADRYSVNTIDDLEAPLAVASTSVRGGTFPSNKFGSMQLLMDAARKAYSESAGDDRKKRLMIVPNCEVVGLSVNGNAVNEVSTTRGTLSLDPTAQVVLANGTIESTRLALAAFPNANAQLGRNLMAHVRTNYDIRIRRQDLNLATDALYASALFVKCQKNGLHYHFQITASAPGPNITNSEAELFRKVPSIDELDSFDLGDENVDVTIRGIGEMTSDRSAAANRVELIANTAQAPNSVAKVVLTKSAQDAALAQDMLAASKQVADALAGGAAYQVLSSREDAIESTHHEAGTLWMGDDPQTSVTDRWGRFHEISNAWVAGPALFPTVGSPNPMLTGVALARRTAERMFEAPILTSAAGPLNLFDGVSLAGWTHVGAGQFNVVGGDLVSSDGPGVLWYSAAQFRDFELTVDWKVTKDSDNGGVFVRFPDPGSDPNTPIGLGYEIQIDELGAPNGQGIHKTGSIYGLQAPAAAAAKPAGSWNTFVINVKGQTYNVDLNGQTVIGNFLGRRRSRGHIGLQNHLPGEVVHYRNITVTPL